MLLVSSGRWLLLALCIATNPQVVDCEQEQPLLVTFLGSLWKRLLSKTGVLTSVPDVPDSVRQPLKVIGAGYGRTGTNSLMLALDRLGYKTYHMTKVMKEGHHEIWSKVANDQGLVEKAGFDDAIATMSNLGYNATVDFPTTCVYEELMERYPDALVILSLTSAEKWADSYTQTIGRTAAFSLRAPLKYIMPSLNWMHVRCSVEHDDDLHISREAAMRSYSKWEVRVKASVPKQKLLVFSYTDGWAPLCEFLAVPPGNCPSDRGEPYPRATNDREHMMRLFGFLEAVCDWWWLISSCVIGGMICGFLLCLRCFCAAPRSKEKAS